MSLFRIKALNLILSLDGKLKLCCRLKSAGIMFAVPNDWAVEDSNEGQEMKAKKAPTSNGSEVSNCH